MTDYDWNAIARATGWTVGKPRIVERSGGVEVTVHIELVDEQGVDFCPSRLIQDALAALEATGQSFHIENIGKTTPEYPTPWSVGIGRRYTIQRGSWWNIMPGEFPTLTEAICRALEAYGTAMKEVGDG